MNKKMMAQSYFSALSLALLLAACGDPTPTDTSTKVTALTDSGAGSLRQAIADAKAGDTLKLTTAGTLTLASPITTDKNLTIVADGVTIDAAQKGRALEVPAGVTVTIKGGTLTGGVGSTLAAGVLTESSVALSSGLVSRSRLHTQGTAQPSWGGVILNKGTLILDGTTVSGGRANLGGGIANQQGATLTLKGNTTVTGNTAIDLPDAADDVNYYGEGGGINNAGTLIMQGGSVSGNSALYVAGGIRNTKTGTLDIQSGTINDNACTYPFSGDATKGYSGCAGGGILSTGTLKMSGGSVSNNTATYFGGGIAAQRSCTDKTCKTYDYSTFTMSGGTISGNKTTGTADNAGGGVWTRANTTITGGTISGNTSMYGGGIQNWHALDMSGGTVQGNTATEAGGGINSSIPKDAGVQLKLSGTASVSGNTAANWSGGVGLHNYTQAVISGGSISGNKVTSATGGAGGIDVGSNAVLTLAGGEIKNNSAPKTAGGILVGGVVNMTGGLIDGNSVTGTSKTEGGGGVRLYAGTKMTASGGTISNNKAPWGAGVMIDGAYQTSPTSEFTLSGATVSGNQVTNANDNGGGFYSWGKLTITSGSVTGNTATGKGGGVYNTKEAVYSAAAGVVKNNNPDDVYTQP